MSRKSQAYRLLNVVVILGMLLSPLPSLAASVPGEATLPAVASADMPQGLATTIVVTSTADSGPGTLRQALLDAVSGDTIIFDSAVFPPTSPVTIALTTGLPGIDQGNLTIDASNAGVILDGSGTPEGTDGFHISSSGNTIKGLQILNFPSDGIEISDGPYRNNTIGGDRSMGSGPTGEGNVLAGNSDDGIEIYGVDAESNIVIGNLIGTDVSGTIAHGNSGTGVRISTGAQQNKVGGTTEGERNVISGNGFTQVEIEGIGTDYNIISGNHIGTDASGLQALGGGYGVRIEGGAQYNVIGGTTSGERNLISGNSQDGVVINDSGTMSNTVVGNFIGTDASGTAALGNGPGVLFNHGSQQNRVEGNVISGNHGDGVWIQASGTMYNVVSGNYIGTNVSGTAAISNTENGVHISGGASLNLIGGSSATPGSACSGECNLISGNGGDGVRIEGSDTMSNIVSSNFIGIDTSGMIALGNNSDGVSIGGQYNRVGGTTPGERNLISGNGDDGVELSGANHLVVGNYIGTNISGIAAISNGYEGIRIHQAYSCTIQGNLLSGNASNGIEIHPGHDNRVIGNLIGTDATGTASVPNQGEGIIIVDGSYNNIIGGNTVADRNIISGNKSDGVHIYDHEPSDGDTISNTAIGNFIGTNISGTAAIPNNGNGVSISDGAQNNIVGGDTSGECNLISGNGGDGVRIEGSDTMSNTVSGNFIGTDASGTAALGNRLGVSFNHGSQQNRVEGNVISGNHGDGVWIQASGTMYNVVSGNYIGTNVSGTAAISNTENGVHISGGASLNLIGGSSATPGSACSGECNLISGNGEDGVQIEGGGAMSNTLSGNYIGTDVNGTAPIGNADRGVVIRDGAQYNVIGGDGEGERNVISANVWGGIEISGASDNRIIGNYLGTDASGMIALGNVERGMGINGSGMDLEATRNLIRGNLISGNGTNGIDLHGAATVSNTVSGNLIGTDVSGTADLGNGSAGVWIGGGAQNNTIGGTTPQDRNVISGNNVVGVSINWGLDSDNNLVIGNYIGTDATGTRALGNTFAGVYIADAASDNIIGGSTTSEENIVAYNGVVGVYIRGAATIRNTITHNSIHSNADKGVELADGGNTELDAPIITLLDLDAGTVTGMACPGCIVEIFSDINDEGEIYEGQTTANVAGAFTFNRGNSFIGPRLNATATNAAGNTSEFSVGVRQVTSLSLGNPVEDSVEPLVYSDYALEIGAGERLLIEVTPLNGIGQIWLYGRLVHMPSHSQYDFQATAPTVRGNYELLVSPTREGVYYFSVFGWDIIGQQGTYTIVARTIDRYLSDVQPRSAGDAGEVTLVMQGLGFVEGMGVELRGAGLPTLTGDDVTLASSTTLWVHYDLNRTAIGVYDVCAVWPGGEEASLTNAFTITQGAGPHLEAQLVVPEAVRPGRQYILGLEYANTGDADMLAPLFVVRSAEGVPMKVYPYAPYQTFDLRILGVASSKPAGLLVPGAEARIPVYFLAPQTEGEITFELEVMTATDEPVDWPGLELYFRPDGIDPGEWQSLWTQAIEGMGSTWGEVLSKVSSAATDSNAPPSELYSFDLIFQWLVALHSDPAASEGLATPQSLLMIAVEYDPWSDVKVECVEVFDSSRPTYVITHGNDNTGDETIFNDLATHIHDLGDVNVVRIKWPKGAEGLNPIPSASRIPQVATVAFAKLKSQFPGLNFANTTFIGHSYGNEINGIISEEAGAVSKGLVLNPAAVSTADFRESFAQSWAFITDSFFDAKPLTHNIAERDIYLKTPPGWWHGKQHGYGLEWLDDRIESGDRSWLQFEKSIPQAPPGYWSGTAHTDGSFEPDPVALRYDGLEDTITPEVPLHDSESTDIIRPVDPNEKAGPAGIGEQRLVGVNDTLEYIIYFENVITATAPAQEVFIVDYLDPDLDWSTFRLIEIAWGDHIIAVPENTSDFYTRETVEDYREEVEKSWWVDVQVALNYATGRVRWTFRTLDPQTEDLPLDPLAGFLPPNDETGRGEGHVAFTIRPRAGSPDGTVLTNEASIIFDTNDPIVTNEVTNTIRQPKLYLPLVLKNH